MEEKELKQRLQASEEKLQKAIALKAKYELKKESIDQELSKLNFDINNIDEDTIRYLPYDVREIYWKYLHTLEAITSTEHKIKDLTLTRDNWQVKLNKEKQKQNDFESVPQVVKDFVHAWRVNAEAWVQDQIKLYLIEKERLYKIIEKAQDYNNDLSNEERKQLYQEEREEDRKLNRRTPEIVIYFTSRAYRDSHKRDDLIKTYFDREERNKILDLIERVTKVTGVITDASMLHIGDKNGELNGYIIGELGKAYIETIGAGGYNIQCFHYRVLVKKIN